MARIINAVKKEEVSADQAVKLRAYVRNSTGNALNPGTLATSAKMVLEFSKVGMASGFPTYELFDMSYFVIASVLGDDLNGQPGIWEPSIDGKEGYNLVVSLPKEIVYKPIPPNTVNFAEALRQGHYRLAVTFSEGTVQEFAISSRD